MEDTNPTITNKSKFIRAMVIIAAIALVCLAVFTYCTRRPSQSVLLLDAAEGGELEKVKALLEQGVPINQTSSLKFGWTPLIAAIYHNETNVVHYLIEAGADVNLPDRSGETPLMWAAIWGDEGIPVVRDLISHGARLDTKDKFGSTVFDAARSVPKLIEVLEAAKAEQEKKSRNEPLTTNP